VSVGGGPEPEAVVAPAGRIDGVSRAVRALLDGVVDSGGDVAGLLADRHRDAARVAVEPRLTGGVADAVDHSADDAGDVDVAVGADLAGDMDQTGGHARLDRDAAARGDRQERGE